MRTQDGLRAASVDGWEVSLLKDRTLSLHYLEHPSGGQDPCNQYLQKLVGCGAHTLFFRLPQES